ncbi:hypothetical protein [Methylobacterium sp. ARG-1]|uniref:hypothetical protein n=1 Tax=Methylobacterium sp. ARG-1 TaxID=1692501 RepID=UPI0006806074|nr:hypothetical protein [Methylobacterium sp. ARG-1]KNY21592.1 hypothetical protein AKJ13_15170 [Methylobacterium sp. ARG-1]
MGFTKSNGSKLFIGPAVADADLIDDVADLSSLTFVEVRGLKDLGQFGDESTAVTSNQLDRNRTLKQKGTRDAGTPAFIMDVKDGDAGQQAILDAETTESDYAFYIEFPNKKTNSGTGTRRYFAGQVMSVRESVGSANNAITMTANVGINTPIFRQAAT